MRPGGRDVAGPDRAAHRDPVNPERADRREGLQGRLRRGIAGFGIADEADLEAARRLAAGQIPDMAEQPADRRPQAMNRAARPGRGCGGRFVCGSHIGL